MGAVAAGIAYAVFGQLEPGSRDESGWQRTDQRAAFHASGEVGRANGVHFIFWGKSLTAGFEALAGHLGLVKVHLPETVTPAEADVQRLCLDSRFRGNDTAELILLRALSDAA